MKGLIFFVLKEFNLEIQAIIFAFNFFRFLLGLWRGRAEKVVTAFFRKCDFNYINNEH